MAGRGKAGNLPAINHLGIIQAIGAHGGFPERRCGNPGHVATGNDRFALDTGFHRRLVNFILPDAIGMNVGLVGEIH